MVAPNYAATRSELAKKLGLGRKPAATTKATPKPKARKAV
jgi:predicted transcriptional regulator